MAFVPYRTASEVIEPGFNSAKKNFHTASGRVGAFSVFLVVSFNFLWPMSLCKGCAIIVGKICTVAGIWSCLQLNILRPLYGREIGPI